MRNKNPSSPPRATATSNLRAMLHGLGEIVQRIGELKSPSDPAQADGPGDTGAAGAPDKAIYSFSFKVGGGSRQPSRAPQRPAAAAPPSVATVSPLHEPSTDLFVEADGVRIIADMPGLHAADIQLELHDDILTLAATAGELRYRKEVLLPRPYRRDQAALTYNNGIVEIWLKDSI